MLIQTEIDFLSVLQSTGTVSKIVLAILLIFSVWSWGIILSKMLLLRKIARESEVFWKIFHKGQTLSEISTASETLRFTPLVPVFNAAADLLKPRSGRGGLGQGTLALKAAPSVANLERVMRRAAAAQLTLVESRLTFLATTAAVAPFVGLFGTVWGVLNAFMGLSNADSASLKAVGPGIAEALITTAFGLLAAIPAVIAYNQFVYRIRNIGGQLDDVQAEMITIAEGNEL